MAPSVSHRAHAQESEAAALSAADLALVPKSKPPVPPISPYIANNEIDIFDRALREADKRRWSQALKLARQIKTKVPEKIILWRMYQDSSSGAKFTDIIEFVEANPDWPRRERLLVRAEEAIPDNLSSKQIISWFAGQEPITGEGKIRLGEAYLDRGDKDFGEFWIRQAWINHSFSSSTEKKILAKHKKRLQTEDHAKRVERLLWSRQTSAARRTMPYMDKEDRAVTDARISLIGKGNISTALSKVPSSRKNDPGLVYEQAKLHRRADRNASVLQVLRQAPKGEKALIKPEDWWLERHIVARRFIKSKQYKEAYELAANHGMTFGGGFADGEFLAGWLALRFLNDPKTAQKHFKTLSEGVGYPISLSRAHYWLGRALEADKKKDEAIEQYAMAAQISTTYYGQLAIEKLQGDKAILSLPQKTSITPSKMAAITSRDIIEAIHLLKLLKQEKTLRVFVLHLADYLDSAEDYAALSDFMYELNHPELGVRVAKRAALKHIFLPVRSYPTSLISRATIQNVKSPIELVLGLSRQESEFNPRAISRAGARGLMQLMPGTAKITARQVSLPYSKDRLTSDPSYNVMLGSAHLADLLGDFNNSYIMTIASYNAGANRTRQWVGDYGDPRLSKVDAIDWVETIPFSETRNYVQRVMENMMVYRNRIAGKDMPLTLSKDLGYKGKRNALAPSRAVKQKAEAKPRQETAALPEKEPVKEVSKEASLAPPKPVTTSSDDTASNQGPVIQKRDKAPATIIAAAIPKVAETPKEPRSLSPSPDPVAAPVAVSEPEKEIIHNRQPILKPGREMAAITVDEDIEVVSVPAATPVMAPSQQLATIPMVKPTPPSIAKEMKSLPTLTTFDGQQGQGQSLDTSQQAPSSIQTDTCKVFIPDSTGGGTCLDSSL